VFFAIFLISCGEEFEPMSEPTPIGEWARHEKFLEFGDSSVVEYSLIIGADSVGLWRMYINDSIKKVVQGKWVMSHDTIAIRNQICSRFESMIPIDCKELPILGDLKFRWYGNRIWELDPSGVPYDRK
jgi:hypothetical protein